MLRLIKNTFLWILCGLIISCSQKKNSEFTKTLTGSYYHLISFENKDCLSKAGEFAKVAVTFSTQKDSVFWDSFNNLNDAFFIGIDSSNQTEHFRWQISKSCERDSGCLLVPTQDFYHQQFNTNQIPFFSLNDSVVKVNYKVLGVLTIVEMRQWRQKASDDEESQIKQYFANEQAYFNARDSMGFYWVEKPQVSNQQKLEDFDELLIAYEGYFLNGRLLEKSPEQFEYKLGVPDQLIKGLKYVISKLKKGENAKIILPSPLAFGENGSSNGTVPPYTPLLYNIKLIDVKEK